MVHASHRQVPRHRFIQVRALQAKLCFVDTTASMERTLNLALIRLWAVRPHRGNGVFSNILRSQSASRTFGNESQRLLRFLRTPFGLVIEECLPLLET